METKTTKQLARELGLLRKRKVCVSPSTKEKKKSKIDQVFSYLIVLDFESTCWENDKTVSQEIIEFPAVLLNCQSGHIESTFHHYILPSENPRLSDFCSNLTGISQNQVDGGIPLSFCLRKFFYWLKKLQTENRIACVSDKHFSSPDNDLALSKDKLAAFVTWSDWDLGVCLLNETKRKQIMKPSALDRWIDLRATYRKFYGRRPDGLNGAMKDLGLQFDGREHSGIADATNTAKLAHRMMRDGCRFQITKSLKTMGSNLSDYKNAATAPSCAIVKSSSDKPCHSSSSTKIKKTLSFSITEDRQTGSEKTLEGNKSFTGKGLSMRSVNSIDNAPFNRGKSVNRVQNSSVNCSNGKRVHSSFSPLAKKKAASLGPGGFVKSRIPSSSPVSSRLMSVQNVVPPLSKKSSHDSSNIMLPSISAPFKSPITTHSSSASSSSTIHSPSLVSISSASTTSSSSSPSSSSSSSSSSSTIHSPSLVSSSSASTTSSSSLSSSSSSISLSSSSLSISLSSSSSLPSSTTTTSTTFKTPISVYKPPTFKRPNTAPARLCNNNNNPTTRLSSVYGSRPSRRPPGSSLSSKHSPSPLSTTSTTTSYSYKTPSPTTSMRHPVSRASTMRVTPPLCSCGRRSRRRLVQNPGPNEGRWFFSCSAGNGSNRSIGTNSLSGCRFFQWEQVV